jgi:hypothetical protein
MDRDRCDRQLGEPPPEGLEAPWWLSSPAPGRGIVDEDLDRLGADDAGPIGGPQEPVTERQVDPQARSGPGRAGQCDPFRPGGPPFV